MVKLVRKHARVVRPRSREQGPREMSDDLDDLLNDVGFAVRGKPEDGSGIRGGAPSWGASSSTGKSAHVIPAQSRNQESFLSRISCRDP